MKTPAGELDEYQRQRLLATANEKPHEPCFFQAANCQGELMAMPGGRTLCTAHRRKHYSLGNK